MWYLRIQRQLVMKNKGINSTFLTVRPRSQWDSWPRHVVNPTQFGTFASILDDFLKATQYLSHCYQAKHKSCGMISEQRMECWCTVGLSIS